MPTLRHIDPIGSMFVPLIGRDLARDEEFEATAEQAAVLLEQDTNYELVKKTTKKKG